MLKVVIIFQMFLFAYIPPPEFILKKTVENQGRGSFQIEQELSFLGSNGVFKVKEIWKVENENLMILKVYGQKELKDKLLATRYYTQGKKWFFSTKGRSSEVLTTDFIEKYHHFRNLNNFSREMSQIKIPVDVNARLARIGGRVSYTFGVPNEEGSQNRTGLWVEQDKFVINKIRLVNDVELLYSNFSTYSNGLIYPLKREVRWDGKSVEIQTLRVTSIKNFRDELSPKVLLQPESFHRLEGTYSDSIRRMVEEFYLRFR